MDVPLQGALTPPALSAAVSNDKPAPGAMSESGYSTPACAAAESLYRLCARTSGTSPPDNGAKTNLAIPFNTSPSCRFSRLQGFAIIQSPLSSTLLPRLVSLLSLAPSGSCTSSVSVAVTSSLRSCPLPASLQKLPGLQRFVPLLKVCSWAACAACEPLPSWVLRPSRDFSRS